MSRGAAKMSQLKKKKTQRQRSLEVARSCLGSPGVHDCLMSRISTPVMKPPPVQNDAVVVTACHTRLFHKDFSGRPISACVVYLPWLRTRRPAVRDTYDGCVSPDAIRECDGRAIIAHRASKYPRPLRPVSFPS